MSDIQMSNEQIVHKMNDALALNGGLKKSIKFNFGDDGMIFAEGTHAELVDKDAACTVTVTKDNFLGIVFGGKDPMMAMISGRLKLSGDRSVAMSLRSLFGSMEA
ncbi:SCP2 sterol-binding domain-containing protein [Novosphingopyxis sp.]|uniref:SCP2 sterol-binding domain-containing protein n=1 Tax=Novosphingopyxis sp. TaxID=2709690 RepID=UPI003B5CEE81